MHSALSLTGLQHTIPGFSPAVISCHLDWLPMPLKKCELYSSLWRSSDELLGGMDASQMVDHEYLLPPNSPLKS